MDEGWVRWNNIRGSILKNIDLMNLFKKYQKSLTGDIPNTPPIDAGEDGQVLTTNGNGGLSWKTPTGGSGDSYTFSSGLSESGGNVTNTDRGTAAVAGHNLAYDHDSFLTSADVSWGEVTGTLADQTDLQEALDDKASETDLTNHISDTNNPHSVTAAQAGAVATTGDETIDGVKTFSSFPILPSSNPTGAYQPATKDYVDNFVTGLDLRRACRVATTANITLSGEQTIDIVAIVTGDRVLVWRQSNPVENGIYVCAIGAWSRADDYNSSAEVNAGTFTFILDGSENVSKQFAQINKNPTLDTDPLVFTEIRSASTYSASNGIKLVSDDIQADLADTNPCIEIADGGLRVKVDDTTIQRTSSGLTVIGGTGGGGASDYVYSTVDFHCHPASAFTLTNMAAAVTAVSYGNKRINLTGAVQYRIGVNQSVAGFAGADLNLQYSTNNSTWFACDTAGAGECDIGTGTGIKVGAWANLVAGSKADVWIRLVGKDGDGIVDPAFRHIWVEFKFNSSVIDFADIGQNAYWDCSIVAASQTAQAWTNMPAAVTELFGTVFSRRKLDLSGVSQYRIQVNQSVAGFAGADLNLQYSLNGSTWVAADTGAAGELDVGTGTGIKTGAWADLATAAKGDVWIRLVGKQGDGAIDPAFRSISVQFKLPLKLNLPQPLDTTDSPTFDEITLTNLSITDQSLDSPNLPISGTYPTLEATDAWGSKSPILLITDEPKAIDASGTGEFLIHGGMVSLVDHYDDPSVSDVANVYSGHTVVSFRGGDISNYGVNAVEYTVGHFFAGNNGATYSGSEDKYTIVGGLYGGATDRSVANCPGKTLYSNTIGLIISCDQETEADIAGTHNVDMTGIPINLTSSLSNVNGNITHTGISIHGEFRTNPGGDTYYGIVDDTPGHWELNYNNKELRFGGSQNFRLYTDGTDAKYINNSSGGHVFDKAITAPSLKLKDGSYTLTIQPPTLAGNVTLTLPADDGNPGQILSTNGSGVLSWVDAPTGGGGEWGTITGNLSDQTDLQSTLDDKQNEIQTTDDLIFNTLQLGSTAIAAHQSLKATKDYSLAANNTSSINANEFTLNTTQGTYENTAAIRGFGIIHNISGKSDNATNAGTFHALNATVSLNSGNATNLRGLEFSAINATNNNIAGNIIGSLGVASNTGTGTVTTAIGLYGYCRNVNSGGTITNAISIYAPNAVKNAGTITTAYGLFVDTINAGTNNYSIYTGTAPTYLGGQVICPDVYNSAASGTAVHVDSAGRLRKTTSSRRYKENIFYNFCDAELIDYLQPVGYTEIESQNHLYGFIAEDVAEIDERLVYMVNGEAETVHYNGVLAIAVQAIKELRAEIKQLKETIQ